MPAETRGRVLVVDDEPDAALSLTTLLSMHGYLARACHDGPTALVADRLVVEEAGDRLRRDRLPVIALQGSAPPESRCGVSRGAGAWADVWP